MLVSLANARGTLYYTQIWSKSTESGRKYVNSLIFNSYAYIRSDRVENSDPVKFVLLDVPESQVGEAGQVGELGQCQWVVLHTDLVKVD